MKKNKGITLVALIITIVVLLILAVVAIREVSGDGIITNAMKARFYEEMSKVVEQRSMKKMSTYIDAQAYGIEGSSEQALTLSELQELDESLKAEIIYTREGFEESPEEYVYTTKQIWNQNRYDCKNIWQIEELANQELVGKIYYISKETTGKEKTYIYDQETDICYKIANTKIATQIVHSMEYAKFALDGENLQKQGIIAFEAGIVSDENGTKYYEPNLNNFSYDTEVIYYSPTFEEHAISAKDYISNGKQKQIEYNGQTYYFCNYTNKIWANVKTIANNLTSYWVWVPRYAYKLNQETQTTDIIYVDLNNNPLDIEEYGSTLPEGYTLHDAFAQGNGLKGIWFSKYNPTATRTETVNVSDTEPRVPDLTKFSANDTKLIYYNQDCTNSIEVNYSQNPERIIEQNGETYYFYNYTNKIWANVKTTANNLISYWVWIPRYAYRLSQETQTTEIIFVDENNKPIDLRKYGDTLPYGYTLHDAFSQGDGLKGIWFSKYNPTEVQ